MNNNFKPKIKTIPNARVAKVLHDRRKKVKQKLGLKHLIEADVVINDVIDRVMRDKSLTDLMKKEGFK